MRRSKIIEMVAIAAAAIAAGIGFVYEFIGVYGYSYLNRAAPARIVFMGVLSFVAAFIFIFFATTAVVVDKGTYALVSARGKIRKRKSFEAPSLFFPIRDWRQISSVSYEWEGEDDGEIRRLVLNCSSASRIPSKESLACIIACCNDVSEVEETLRKSMYKRGILISECELCFETKELKEASGFFQ